MTTRGWTSTPPEISSHLSTDMEKHLINQQENMAKRKSFPVSTGLWQPAGVTIHHHRQSLSSHPEARKLKGFLMFSEESPLNENLLLLHTEWTETKGCSVSLKHAADTQTHTQAIKTEQGSCHSCRGNQAALLCACLNSVLYGLSAESTSQPGKPQQLWYTTHAHTHTHA